jgi:hypothetical protein
MLPTETNPKITSATPSDRTGLDAKSCLDSIYKQFRPLPLLYYTNKEEYFFIVYACPCLIKADFSLILLLLFRCIFSLVALIIPILLALPRLMDETYVVGYCFESQLGNVLVPEFS